jgi:hypothetical protein
VNAAGAGSPPARRAFRRAVAAALPLAVVVGGCATAHVANPLTGSLAASTPEVQGEFWYQLAKRPLASNDEAFHALLLYQDGQDPDPTYAARVHDLQARQMLPSGFAGGADDAVDRGTLAVALDHLLHIKGGLTMQLFGPSPRYALRAAVADGIFPDSSPNQAISGGEFVGVMQRAEEFEHGNPADGPAHLLPDQVHHVAMREETPPAPAVAAAAPTEPPPPMLYLDDVLAATAPSGLPAGPVHLRAIVTGIQGELVEIRSGPTAAWQPARPGMVMREGTEIRTGPKSAIRFLIPADEAFCLDSQGAITLQQAVLDMKKAKTRLGLEHGRLREDLSHAAPVQIEQAGVEHDTVIQSPDSALALRGTQVSLFEQPSFAPVAVSLTGQATFTNTDGIRVPFGGTRHAVIVGAQTSAVQEAAAVSSAASGGGNTPRLEFDARELAIVSQRGGFQRGDVIIGDLNLSDFGYHTNGAHTLPGGLDFVLQWSGATPAALNDLNLAVFSPLNTVTSPDFVANPPFTVSLTPTSPTSQQLRRTTYPEQSRSGGQISLNSVGPDGLELAFWPKTYPTGHYNVVVYDLVDSVPATTTNQVNPVTYTLTTYQNGVEQTSATGTLGQLQYTAIGVNVVVPPVNTLAVRPKSKRATSPAVPVKIRRAGHREVG